jgi:polyphosphate kinase
MTEAPAATSIPMLAAAAAPAAARLVSRESAILDFNHRVLAQAQRADVPPLERLRYLTIVSSNLDEFFEVRFAELLEASRSTHPTVSSADVAAVSAAARALLDAQYRVFNDEVMPALRQHGVVVLNHTERDEAQRKWVARYFARQVRPLLVPVSAGSVAPVSAGRQQVAELHLPPRRARRLRAGAT